MTVIEPPLQPTNTDVEGAQRFIFNDADWNFYESVGRNLGERRVFATYYKGRLEVVTVSLLHERITSLLAIMVRVLAEETSLPLGGAGMTTLKRMDLDAGVEPDSSFYTTHELQMRGKSNLDLTNDPPPDLAIEVEVTRRLGARKSIYRELGVPEVWVYSPANGLTVLLKQGDSYVQSDRSPTFSLISPGEMSQFVSEWAGNDETAFTKAFRRRVQQVVG
jgi:Uma2 family endonuclease